MIKMPVGRRRGFTLIEMMVAIGVSGFIFAMLGSMIFIAGRSSMNIHSQVLSQIAAAKTSERVTNMLRNAVAYRYVSGDEDLEDIVRVYAEVPTGPSSTATHTLAIWKDSTTGKQELRYYESRIESWNVDKTTGTDAEPAFRSKLTDFKMKYVTEYRLVLTTSFVYKGFVLIFDNPGMPQHGDFITEALAKNHFMDMGADNYAQADDLAIGPASL